MFQVSGIYMDDLTRRLHVPIGFVSHIDINISSTSFWCFESEENTQSPNTSPHLITLCHVDLNRISYSRSDHSCRLSFKRPAFEKSSLSSMLEVSPPKLNILPTSANASVSDDEDGSYNILAVIKESDFANFQNAMKDALYIATKVRPS